MKPTMVTAICLLTAIIIVSSFGLQLDPVDVATKIPDTVSANVLYVCPATSTIWDPIAAGFSQFSKFFKILFAACLIVLSFSWGWALYQNLLKDKFDGDKYKQPWGLTKMLFWAVVIIFMLMMTPNYFRSVHVNGVNRDYVLCEFGDDGARPVRADIVSH
ncbi:MAG: hypothetical protein IKB05_00960 [Alphaproteobacteria bacterium]|nr:hypothetical protein [Alphaproteobacteria bacterium]MBQ3039826.1 hypothetical protein [Alphaproteobacteria bacterium]MBQ7127871.1 hypothetical protein [Alphaproteobacteria bacterium]MBR2393043.1 hypothetical protein [Alphaproteobacteria bacterium]